MKILVTDDHPIVRKGVVQIVTRSYPDCEIDEASTGGQALEMALQSDYDLILLDISLPDMNGLDVLRQIKEKKNSVVVLVISILPEKSYAIRALKFGASGYLTKSTAPEELIVALQKVMRGGKYVSADLSEHFANLISGSRINDSSPHEKLSPREFQIMGMIVSGMRLSDIAGRLFISVKTVSTHRARILKKMCMKSNAELANYALENHLYT